MKLVEVFHTSTEAEARMWEEALKSKGIPAFVELPTTNQFLRAGNAGAAQPFDVWLIKVQESKVSEARDILPEPQKLNWKINRPRSLYLKWVIISVMILLVMYAISYILMISYISQQ